MSETAAIAVSQSACIGSPRPAVGRFGRAIVAAAEPATITRPEVDERVRQLPPYRVLLHNDDVNTFEHVILTILRLTPLNEHDAVLRTVEAHSAGLALLLMTHKERAELYVEQFATFKLTVTCEPDG